MMVQLNELETYITPDMNVYSSLVETGFGNMLFSTYRDFLRDVTILEEFIEITIEGTSNPESARVIDFSRFFSN